MPKLKEIGLMVENVNARDYVSQAQAAEQLGVPQFLVARGLCLSGSLQLLRRHRGVDEQDQDRHRCRQSLHASSRRYALQPVSSEQ